MKYTIKNDLIYEEKIKKSLFIGHLRYVSDTESARAFIQEISKLHPQANHNCPAYIIGKNGEIAFSSDDREPSGTAGKPLLNMLQRHELTNVAIVVTRYFGGVELGIRGLIEAYGGVAERTILSGEKVQMIDYFYYKCEMSYHFYKIFLHKIQLPDVIVKDTVFTDIVEVKIEVSEMGKDKLLIVLQEMMLGQNIKCSELRIEN